LLIEQINKENPTWKFLGFYDDLNPSAMGKINDLNNAEEKVNVVIAIADQKKRNEIVNRLTNKNLIFPILIHPSVQINSSLKIGEGSIITSGCILTKNITIGKHCIINLASTIGHDVVIADFCSVMPNVSISGSVKLENEVFIGTGAIILQNLKIEKYSIIGAGALVTKSLSGGKTYVGIPARELR